MKTPVEKHLVVKERGAAAFNVNRTILFLCPLIIIIAVSTLVYLNTLGNGFAYDDKFTITNNYLIRSWHKIPAVFTRDYFAASGELSYRPVVTLSYFLDYSLWHLNPAGYHLTNLFFHSLNAVLLFFLFVRLPHITGNEPGKETELLPFQKSKVPTLRTETLKITIAFIASLIFCIHPVLTEAVNSISYREDIMAATFYFAAFLFYLLTQQRGSALWYTASLTCYFMGLFSKEMTITLPALMVLYDFLSQGKSRLISKAIRYYIGYIAVSVFYISLRFVFLHNPTESYIPYPQNSLWVNFLTMSKVIASYLTLLFFPANLNADYVIPSTLSPAEIPFIVSFLLLIATGVIAYRLFSYSRVLCFYLLWFFVALLPVMNIVPIENIMAERYLYIPLAGFCMLGSQLLNFIPASFTKPNFLKSYSLPLIVVILVGFSGQTCSRARIWFDELSLWSTTIINSPQSSRAHNNLGVLYKKMGFMDAAIQEYETAIKIRPDYSEAHGNLGNAYMDKDVSVVDKLIASAVHKNLAKAYADEGYFKGAIAEYKKSIAISPFNEIAHFNLGVTYGKLGLTSNAEIEYENALRINGNNPHAHNNLGNIYEDKGLLEKALTEYKLSLSIDPTSAITHNNVGNIYFKKEMLDEAILEYKLAIKNAQSGIVYHENLANTCMKKGLIEEAIAAYESLIGMRPNNSQYYTNVITLYWNHKKDAEKTVFYLRKLSEIEPGQREAINKMIEKLGVKK